MKSDIEMIEEWEKAGETMTPIVLRFDYTDFDAMLERLTKLRDDPDLDEKTVNSSTFWLVDRHSRVVGAVNIRYRLNPYLLEVGGHIGYGVRPSERGKGYASIMLKQALLIAKKMGIVKALLTCDKENVASAKTIVKNGGVLDSEGIYKGKEIQRYWIDLAKI